jgi:carbon-monoxide dehydrogenase medium subunit
VHDAVARVTGPAGDREVPVADLFLGFFETVVGEDEILRSVAVPAPAAGLRTGYLKFLPRTKDDYSTIAVAAGLVVDDGRITSARIAVAGGGATPLRCAEAESALVGAAVDDATLEDAAGLVRGALEPISDARGSAGYKREMARVCTGRLLRRLAQEAAA